MSKFRYFREPSKNKLARFVSVHMPRGRVWNTREGSPLWKLIKGLSDGVAEISRLTWEMISDFNVDTTTVPEEWEESLEIDIDTSKTISQRRAAIKAQIRKIVVVTISEWETQLRTGTRNDSIEVYPASSYPHTGDFVLPNDVPTPLYMVDPNRTEQNRFVLYVDYIADEDEKNVCENNAKKFSPINTYNIYIIR